MQENHPPHSMPEIQAMISQSLDGALDPDEQRQLEKLLDEYPVYREEWNKLRTLRGAVQQSSGHELEFTKVSNGVWENLFKQLQEDQHAELMDVDPEFICAYYDHEIPAHDPQLKTFESQLFRNREANDMLGGMAQVSEAVRQFSYRLEESCTLDISQQVMAAYRNELGLGEDAPNNPTLELLSAHVDQELSGKEQIEANRLIENDPAARETVRLFSQLSERIQAISEELQQQAPDLWPAVQQQLLVTPLPVKQAGKVVTLKRALSLAVPASVAAVLLLFAMPMMNDSGTYSKMASPMQEADLIAYEPGAGPAMQAAEIASIDNATPASLRQAVPGNGNQPMLAPSLADRESNAMPERELPALKPMLDPSAPAPAAPSPARGREAKEGGPSSDEYLFDALSQQMTSEEILALLGD